jgi:hypothetical protein
VRQQLRAFTDGKGRWVLAVPYGAGDSPVFAGDGLRFWRVRVHGTFGNPNAKEWSRSFWDPRSAPDQMVPSFEGEAPVLWCGGQKLPWQAAPEEEGRRLVEAATLLEAGAGREVDRGVDPAERRPPPAHLARHRAEPRPHLPGDVAVGGPPARHPLRRLLRGALKDPGRPGRNARAQAGLGRRRRAR